MLNKEDIERITKNILSQLKIEAVNGSWTDPNTRAIRLKLNGEVISETYFNVVQQREYEG